MKTLLQLLSLVVTVWSFGLATPALADPTIDISFESSDNDAQKLVRAQAVFPMNESVVLRLFQGITDYPAFHHWIHKTRLLSQSGDTREFRIEFDFPWPVGRQWSRVEVTQVGQTIVWKQIEGTLKANHGRIEFKADCKQVQIDYRAAMDIGLPESVTRSFKQRFVNDFLSAVYHKAESVERSNASILALGD